jgi:cytochrome c553
LLKAEGAYRFHVYLHGQATVRVGDQVVLDAAQQTPGWASGPELPLGFGELPFRVDFTPPAAANAGTLKLYWSSDSFPLEPVPHHVLFHSEESAPLRQQEQGRLQLAAAACVSCHAPPHEQSRRAGPSLKHVGSGSTWSSLRERLTRTEADPDQRRMPVFGFSAADAEAILAYLARHADALRLAPPAKVKVNEKTTPTGRELISSVGCLACHEWRKLGQRPAFGGGRLDAVAQRRSRAWLDQWLRDPAVIDANHHMPVFSLSDAERQQIVDALCQDQSLPKETPPETTAALVERGRTIIEQARCANCHELPGPPLQTAKLPTDVRGQAIRLAADTVNAHPGCLQPQPDAGRFRPAFPAIDAGLVRAALQHQSRAPSLLQTKNCLACHDRDGSRGLSAISLAVLRAEPQWQGQTPTLSPPPLTSVGDKLLDAALAKAIRGEQTPRLPWLKVRMPRFKHSDEEAAALLHELIDHDRIPPAAPATPAYPIHRGNGSADPQVLLAGRELTGGKGFSCVACHALKDYVPKQVALGTRGSDLYRLGDRLRPEFFFRWTRSPLRIVPGVEMPSYLRPHPTLLDGQLNRQLAAIWDALHDPNFTAPTNPAVVEQFWTLQRGDRPRIIRDVFTIPGREGNTESVPRAFAVGFSNGHSVLFDLERAAVRAWTIGDFARQRTQGKSWFWDLAGATVASAPPANDFRPAARNDAGRTWRFDAARLHSYAQDSDRVRLTYEVSYASVGAPSELDGRAITALVQEEWRAVESDVAGGLSGWERAIEIVPQPGFPALVFAPPEFQQTFGEPRLLAAWPDRPEKFVEFPREGLECREVPGVPNQRFGLRVR